MDRRWPNGVLLRRLGRDQEPTRSLDPEALARLDYFLYCCIEQGIYIDSNLNVCRLFTAGDGVKQAEWLGFSKALTYVDPQLIRLQKEYAAQLLGHVNPFTGRAYADEPAVALVELVNENSILESWTRGRLRGEQRVPFGTWGDIPPAYAPDLRRLWNDWLARRYPDRAALAAAWDGDLREYEDARQGSVRRLQPEEFAGATAGRFRDEASFYAELERNYYQEMDAFLRGEVGVRQLILGTSDHNHSWHGALHVENNTALDLIDGHCYWQHPRYGSSAATGYSQNDWSISNTPMVNAPDHSAPSQLSRSRVLGLPYIVSEVNEPFPNDYAAEYFPILAAYALLQDWDGIFSYCYGAGVRGAWQDEVFPPFFPLHNDPVKMPQMAIGALLFLRGDVQAARQVVPQHLTHERVLDSLRSAPPTDEFPYALPWLQGRLALVHGTGIADFHAEILSPAEGEWAMPTQRITSDTGELVWLDDGDQSVVLIDARCHQAVIGHVGSVAVANFELELTTQFAAVQLASLDGMPIAEATQLLLVTAARVANTGMAWTDETRRSLGGSWGGGPTRIEPVTGRLSLRKLSGARSVSLQPLDANGQADGPALPFRLAGDGFSVVLPGTTPWYAVTVARQEPV